jgi:hypothetical protein
MHPNLHDLAREIISDYEMSIIRNFAIKNRVSFSRVEPRIVSLIKNDALVYQGFRKMNKENTVWFSELRGKKVLTPDLIKGFLGMRAITEERKARSDFRGSEFSTITSPKITQEWFEKPVEERYLGCSIDKLIVRTPNETRTQIIKEQIPFEQAEDVKKLLRLFDKDFNFKPIILGTAVHKLYSTPLKGLAHYKTLELAGLNPTSSDRYTETQFNYRISLPTLGGLKEIVVSMKPDAYLLLERSPKEYDLIIIDLKTSRVLQYPEQNICSKLFSMAGL